MNRKSLFAAYLRQQDELGLPEIFLGPSFDYKRLISALLPASPKVQVVQRTPPQSFRPAPAPSGYKAAPPRLAPVAPSPQGSPFDRLAGLKPLAPVAPSRSSQTPRPAPVAAASPVSAVPIAELMPLSFDEKRTIFTTLFRTRCENCPLTYTRNKFVFGSGNVDAPLMIIGEAPGAEEDEQGVPFVGAAGRLLTELLATAGIDRKTETFIANVLKCRPPNNRTPNANEIATCFPLLVKQIEIVAPRALILLGKVAVSAILQSATSMAQLRGMKLEYRGIPVFVTYHPSYLLRKPEDRKLVEDDLRAAAAFIKKK